jgi:WD40 repeat protein
VLRFFDAIESSAPHIYASALPWSPSSSLVRALYGEQMSTVKFSVIDDTWNACIRAIQPQRYARSVEFSHKDSLIAVGESDVVEVFEATTGERRATLTTNKEVMSLAFSPDDTLLVTGDAYGTVVIWDLQTGSFVGALEGHTEWIRSIAFSLCGTMIATSSNDRTVRVWNVSTLDCRCILEGHRMFVQTVCWSEATGREVISGSWDSTIKTWSISAVKCTKTFTIHSDNVLSVASSPDSSLIASGSDGRVNVFHAETGDVLHAISTDGKSIYSVRFLNQDQIMYTNSGTFVIRDFTKSDDVLTFEYEGGDVALFWDVSISSDGTRLVSSDRDIVKIWQTNSKYQNQDMTGHHTARVHSISFSRDGRLAISGSEDNTVKIWDTTTARCLTTLSGHPNGVYQVLFSPDSILCASWGGDHVIRIWDVRNGRPAMILGRDLHSVRGICFSPNGGQLVSVKQLHSPDIFLVELWDVTRGGRLAWAEIEDGHTSDDYRNLSFGVDGTSIVLRFVDKTYRWILSSSIIRYEPRTNSPSYLPMTLVSEQDTALSTRPDISPHQYYHDRKHSWIQDRQGRRVLWVPHDLRQKSDCYGEKVVFGSNTGRVVIADFSDD